MAIDHISNEAMRSYLLGRLPDDQATALEEEYFSNRDFFLKIQSEETALIVDYLDGKLSSADKQHFEDRYLQVPLLQRKVEEVRRQRNTLKPALHPSIWTGWRVAFALAAVLVFGLGISVYRLRVTNQHGSLAGNSQTHSVIAIRISPGLTKGSDSTPTQIEPPSDGSTVNLILELPGRSAPAQCQVRISLMGPDGHWAPVWTSSGLLTSSADGNGQVLTLQIDGALQHPGDYSVDAWSPDGEVRETYSYQVKRN
jgi:hypothetical protein